MELEAHDIDLIEKAIDQELSESEKLEFEKKLQSSGEFKAYYDQQQSLLDHLRAYKKNEVRNELKALYDDFKNEKEFTSTSRFSSWLKYGIAAALAIVVAVFIWRITNAPKTTQQLYTEYYTPYEGGPLLRGEEQDSMQMALSAYYRHEYEKALSLFLRLEGPKRFLLIGNCYMNLEDYQKAERALKEEYSKPDTPYKDEARWYLALLYLQQNQKENAVKALKELQEGYYYDKAREILRELD
ncbi:MAG: tetratricopeptide repeat protein [Bacteroidota bacterium]